MLGREREKSVKFQQWEILSENSSKGKSEETCFESPSNFHERKCMEKSFPMLLLLLLSYLCVWFEREDEWKKKKKKKWSLSSRSDHRRQQSVYPCRHLFDIYGHLFPTVSLVIDNIWTKHTFFPFHLVMSGSRSTSVCLWYRFDRIFEAFSCFVVIQFVVPVSECLSECLSLSVWGN